MKKIIGCSLLVIPVITIMVGYLGIRKLNNALFKEKPNYLEYTYEAKAIHFDWAGDSIGKIYEPQAAVIIPLKFEGLAHHFYMQFDTGTPHSYIYENDLMSLRAIGLDIKEVIIGEERYVEHLDFILDDNHIKASMIKIFPNYGHSFEDKDTIYGIGIGTIGSDFIDQRIIAIDFINQNLQIYNTRPDWIASLSGFKSFDFSGRSIMLPVVLNNKKYEFLYDSGCSAFGLITIKSRFDKYADNNVKDINYDAKSWKSSIPITSKPSVKPIIIGNASLKLQRVSYVNMYTALQPIVTPFTRIGGWLGNQPFNESTLIIDTQKEEFIVIKS